MVDDPEEQLSGALKFSYLVNDDYGLVAAEGRITPLPHPDHQAFVKVLRPVLDKVMVIDYWTKK